MPDKGSRPALTMPAERDWRADAQRTQQQVLPKGATVVSGTGPYGVGGLGQHLAELVEALRATGSLHTYLSPEPRPEDVGHTGIRGGLPSPARAVMAIPPVRYSLGWRTRLSNQSFDRIGARRLPPDAEHLLVFNGQALSHISQARRLGYGEVGLVSANGHLAHVARQHERAWRQYPIERPWGPTNVSRNLSEYRAADYVHVSSPYAWDTFVDQGFPEERLRMFPLTPNPRFQPRTARPTSSTFDVVYVGSLSVHKGVPLLIDAVGRLGHQDLRLVLVGGCGTRNMRRYVEGACARDRRIVVRPGDSHPSLMQAGVAVHASYEEGCAYAPAEALACGVPLILSKDTGMNPAVGQPGQRWEVPTGDLAALADAIDMAYHGSWPTADVDAGRGAS